MGDIFNARTSLEAVVQRGQALWTDLGELVSRVGLSHERTTKAAE